MTQDHLPPLEDESLDEHDGDSWRESLSEEVTGRRSLRVADREARPDIQLGPDVHVVTERMLGALKGDPLLYRRGGALVHVTRVAAEDVIPGSPPGTPLTRQVPLTWLVNRVSRFARCVTERKKKDGQTKWLHVPPPSTCVRAVLEAGEWPGLRELRGVLEAPSIRPDGTLIQDAGYDAATGYLYVPNATYAPVDEHPTQDQARAALDELVDVFSDFPYAKPHHAMIPIAALLTILARPAILGAVPAFLFDASTRGSGKTLQCDVVSAIATGRTAARVNYPEKDEELEKTLAAFAMGGASTVLLDNVTRTLGGGPLDAVLTCREDVEFRVLGRTETMRLPWRAVMMVSGNNLVLGEDTTRRCLIARLESPLENPEERAGFAHADLIGWVKEHRPRLIRAALTVLRGYTCKKCPDTGGGIWGSFEEWSKLIPRAIVFAGGADPLLARATQLATVNDAKISLEALLDGLRRLSPGLPMSAKGIIAALYPDTDGPRTPDQFDPMRDAIEQETNAFPGRAPDAKRFGKWLQRVRGRVVGGWCVQRCDGRAGSAAWRAVMVSSEGLA
jgi:putative DNA primase/helicase